MSNVATKGFAPRLVLTVVAVVALGLLGSGSFASPPGAGGDAGPGGDLAGSNESFTIDGSTTAPISPGVRAPLDLRLTNNRDFRISLTDLRVTIRKVTAPNADKAHPCAIRDFALDQIPNRRTITLAARSTRTLSNLGLPPAGWPHVGMLNHPSDQDGCNGASLALAYTATGTRAS